MSDEETRKRNRRETWTGGVAKASELDAAFFAGATAEEKFMAVAAMARELYPETTHESAPRSARSIAGVRKSSHGARKALAAALGSASAQ